MNLCPYDSSWLLNPPWIVTWKPGAPVPVCVGCSHPASSPTPWLEGLHESVHEFMSNWLAMSAPLLCKVWLKSGCPCISVPTTCLECVHVFMSIWLPIFAWSPFHSYIETWVPLCCMVCVCTNHSTSGHTPCLECAYPSVHVLMSIWLPMIAQPTVDSYMETWVPLCTSVCVSQSPFFWSHTLFRMCTCLCTSIYVHLSAHACSTLMHCLIEIWVALYVSLFVSQSP